MIWTLIDKLVAAMLVFGICMGIAAATCTDDTEHDQTYEINTERLP